MTAGDLFAGRYRLLEPLGQSAMSSVWLADDEELQRRVAVKTLAPTGDPARFDREARAAALLSHPNIVALYDYGQVEGRRYMVFEHLSSGSLEDRLRSGRLDDPETQRIAGEIAAGLEHAHERGLVHRDLKPANVLFDAEDRAKIADFGIARMSDSTALTAVGTVLGTAATISPEQASGAPAGPASDVYSFGVVLFRMLTGAAPFVSDNAMELVRMHRDDPAPAVSQLRPGAPPHLARLADAALAKSPAARPPDGAALVQALAAGPELEETRILARPRDTGRTILLLVAAAFLALLAAGGTLAYLLTRTDSSPSPVTFPSTLTLPTAPTTTPAPPTTTAPSTPTTAPTTTAPTTTAPTTTAPTTTAATTTARVTTAPTTTAPTTTAPVTTAPATTAATTTAETTATVDTTTVAATP